MGIFALGIAAVYPPLVLLSTVLLSETLFITLEVAVLLAVLRARRSERPVLWGLAAGLLAGLAVLTRQNGVVLLLPAALALWSARPGAPVRRRLEPVLALLAVTAVVVAPWSIRNTSELDHFVPVATQTGVLLAGIYNDSARTDPDFPGAWRPPNAVPDIATCSSARA